MTRRKGTLEEQIDRARGRLRAMEIALADADRSMPGGDDAVCRMCQPFDCGDPDTHLGVPSYLTPNKNRGCRCGSDYDGRDCMCFEGDF